MPKGTRKVPDKCDKCGADVDVDVIRRPDGTYDREKYGQLLCTACWKAKEYFCQHCGNKAPWGHNFCSWECHIEAWRQEGGKEIRPNGLPITCLRAHDGAMLEHEHADHPHYKFPIDVDYVGDIDPSDKDAYAGFLKEGEEVTDNKIRKMLGERHALLYADECVAISIYEHCYAMWDVKTGACEGGSLWIKRRLDWKLSDDAMKKINELIGRDQCRS